MPQTAVTPDPRAIDVFVTEDMLLVGFADGRELSVPLAWSEKLLAGSAAARANCAILDDGARLSWPDLGEEIVVASLLRTR